MEYFEACNLCLTLELEKIDISGWTLDKNGGVYGYRSLETVWR